MKKIHVFAIAFLLLGISFSCKKKADKTEIQQIETVQDPLPSFNEVPSKENIINFVKAVTDSANKNYVAPENRIVCFDNDGTLWAEQSLPSQIYFVFDKVKGLAEKNPKYKTESPYKEVIENDMGKLLKADKRKLIKMIGEVDSIYNSNYSETVNNWIDTAQHPVLKRTYAKSVYQPMLELLDYLRANEFTIYIVSGGGLNFMRAWQPRIYGIEENQIIGTTFKSETIQKDDSIAVVPTSRFEFLDDHMGKVINIEKIIGKKPIMIVGNSDGDLEMMEYASTDNPFHSFMLYVNHTDGEREFLYTDKTPFGRLEKGKKVAEKNGWTIIDMKNDWKTVFPK